MLKRKSLKAIAIYAPFLVLGADLAAAAGFDCNKASTKSEFIVCSDDNLGKLDSDLGSAYSALMANLPPERKSEIKSEQIKWLRQQRDKCSEEISNLEGIKACLQKTYSLRISILSILHQEENLRRTNKELARVDAIMGGQSARGEDSGSQTHSADNFGSTLREVQAPSMENVEIEKTVNGFGRKILNCFHPTGQFSRSKPKLIHRARA